MWFRGRESCSGYRLKNHCIKYSDECYRSYNNPHVTQYFFPSEPIEGWGQVKLKAYAIIRLKRKEGIIYV